MRSIFSILTLAVLFNLACSEKSKNPSIIDIQQAVTEERKYSAKSDLKTMYDIGIVLDTMKILYSYEADTVINSKYQLIENFRVLDIYRKDSLYYALISIKATNYQCDLEISPHLIKSLPKKKAYYDVNWILFNSDKSLVVSISSIRKARYILSTDVEEDYDEDFPEKRSYEVNLNIDLGFIASGKIIDIR